jgi:hypothetical protein
MEIKLFLGVLRMGRKSEVSDWSTEFNLDGLFVVVLGKTKRKECLEVGIKI